VDRDYRSDRAATSPWADVGSIGHVSSTRTMRARCRNGTADAKSARHQPVVPGAFSHLSVTLSGWSCSFVRRRGSLFRPCSQFRAASRDPWLQSPVSNRHSWFLPLVVSSTEWLFSNAGVTGRFTILIEIRELP
jgi:hypothetical protein